MEIIIFLIPIVTLIILVSFFRKQTAWWEYFLVIPSLLLFVLLKGGMIYCNSLDTEYLGDLISDITYYEDWDETVMVAHHYTTGSGKHRVTHTYYVPERRYHPAKYIYETVQGSSGNVDEDCFHKITNNLNVTPTFKDMHRAYRSKDGDAYVYTWDKSKEHSYAVTVSHEYVNKVKASSNSIFKYHISDEDVEKYKLYDYPKIIDEDQNTIIGYNASKEDQDALKYFNGYRGPKNQIRVFILCFNNKPMEISELQKAYWQGGNKNELVVCLGLKGNKVTWCNAFSWCDRPALEVMSKNYFIKHPQLNIKEYVYWLNTKVDKNWKRKNFDDFNYLTIDLKGWQYILILILILIYNVCISYWVITNNFTECDPTGKTRSYNYWRY